MTNTWATGFQSGPPAVTAAEFAKGVGAIYNTTVGAPAASVDITGIVSNYAHLLIIAYLRGDAALTSLNPLIRFNNDSSAIYDWQNLDGAGATASASTAAAQTSGRLGYAPGSTATADVFGLVTAVIPHYAGSLDQKVYGSEYFHKHGTASGSMFTGKMAGFWRSAAAINRVTLIPSSGNWDIGSRVTVYAMGA